MAHWGHIGQALSLNTPLDRSVTVVAVDYPPTEIPWPPGARRPDYWLTLKLGEVRGRLECVSVTVRAEGEGRVVSSATMRALPIARLVAEAVRKLRIAVAAGQIDPGPPPMVAHLDGTLTEPDAELRRHRDEFWAQARQWADELAPILARSGRFPPEHLQHVARVYKEAARWQRNPTAAVGEHYGVTRSAAAKWVSRARQGGLLPPARPGRADPPPKPTRPRRKSP